MMKNPPIRSVRSIVTILLLVLLPALALPPSVTGQEPAGFSRATPVPGDKPVTSGPWIFTIQELLTGDAATKRVTDASADNSPPAEGMQYVAVRLSAENQGTSAYSIAGDDFGITGDDNLLRRAGGVTIPPDPAINATISPGETGDGWIVGLARTGEGNLMLVYSSTSLGGTWADVIIALDPGASIPDRESRGEKTNTVGREIGQPARMHDRVVTREWALTVEQVLEGQDVYNLFPREDYRTTALGDTDTAGLPYWVGIKITITNNRAGGAMAYLPPTALAPVDQNGQLINDVLWLTPPSPDTTGEYFPGGTREGWVIFSLPVGETMDLVRFQPYSTDTDVRYVTLANASQAIDPNITFTNGETVIVTDNEVRMRAEASVNAAIVATLAKGTALVVEGAAIEADGYIWYPVSNPATGERGYVVRNYLSYAA